MGGASVPIMKDKDLAIKLMQSGVKKKNKTLTQCIANAIGWGLYDKLISDQEIEIVRKLSQSGNPWVRKSIVRSVERFSPNQKTLALDILLGIKFTDSKEITDEVLGEFENKHGKFKIKDLSESQLKELLENMVGCPSIDDYHIKLFLSKLSLKKPKETVKFLKDRVEFSEANRKLKDYSPLPFSWERNEPLHFHKTDQYEELLKDVRDWATIEKDGWMRFHYGSILFKMISSGFNEIALKVLGEWLFSTDESKLVAASTLIGEAPKNFVWEKQQFVIKVLDHAQKFGTKCYKRVSSSLYRSVQQGLKSGKAGQPFPADIEQRDKSSEMMRKLPPGSPEYRFYKALYEDAKSEIANHEDFES